MAPAGPIAVFIRIFCTRSVQLRVGSKRMQKNAKSGRAIPNGVSVLAGTDITGIT